MRLLKTRFHAKQDGSGAPRDDLPYKHACIVRYLLISDDDLTTKDIPCVRQAQRQPRVRLVSEICRGCDKTRPRRRMPPSMVEVDCFGGLGLRTNEEGGAREEREKMQYVQARPTAQYFGCLTQSLTLGPWGPQIVILGFSCHFHGVFFSSEKIKPWPDQAAVLESRVV